MNRTFLWKTAASVTFGSSLTFYLWSNRERFVHKRQTVFAAESQSDSSPENLTQDKATSKNVSTSSESIRQQMQLKNVQIFFRHGARTPLRHAPGIEEARSSILLILSLTILCRLCEKMNSAPCKLDPLKNSLSTLLYSFKLDISVRVP